jgi:hypothetical protein
VNGGPLRTGRARERTFAGILKKPEHTHLVMSTYFAADVSLTARSTARATPPYPNRSR